MKKWISLYIVILLAALAAFGVINGKTIAAQADIGIVCQDNGHTSQVIRTKEHQYVLYQNPDESKFQIAVTDKNDLNSKSVGTVHQNGVYYLFQYADGNKTFIGIEPLGSAIAEPAAGEEKPAVPVIEVAGDFLAAGSTEQAIFFSVLGADGRTITEYALMTGTQEWIERQSTVLPEGHFVISGAYEGDVLWVVREDGAIYSIGVVMKEMDETIENTVLFDSLKHFIPSDGENLWKMTYIKEAAGLMILPSMLIALVLTGLTYGIRKRNHMIFQMICYAEIISLAAVLYVGYAFTERLTEEEVLEKAVDAGYALEEMMLNQRADGTVEPGAYWEIMKEKEGLLADLIIVDAKTDEVLLSKTLPAGGTIYKYYGEEMLGLTSQVLQGQESVIMPLHKADKTIYTVGMRDWTAMDPDTVLIAILSAEGIENSMAGSQSDLRDRVGGFLGLVTIANGVLFLFFSNRWQKFEEGIAYVAMEKRGYPDIPILPDGMQSAWAALDDIGHTIGRLHYEKDLLYRSYYKFVPKGMDELLNKPALADIEVGDKAKVRGCMVDIVLEDMKHLKGMDYQNTMTHTMELMHKVREQKDGIFLSASTDLHERKVFFDQNATRALQFAVDLIHAYAEKNLLADNDFIMMLHAAEFQYGISGVKEMMTPYMYSQQESILEPYAKALAKAKVRVAMTEQTLRLVGNGFYTRYIGFVSGGEDVGSLKLYECLDAYSETQRKLMMETDVMFQRGLQLFYSNDFYLARNTFNEVLKLNEQDRVARWYLFHCEYHLNHPEAEVSYGLFENTVLGQK